MKGHIARYTTRRLLGTDSDVSRNAHLGCTVSGTDCSLARHNQHLAHLGYARHRNSLGMDCMAHRSRYSLPPIAGNRRHSQPLHHRCRHHSSATLPRGGSWMRETKGSLRDQRRSKTHLRFHARFRNPICQWQSAHSGQSWCKRTQYTFVGTDHRSPLPLHPGF